MEIIINGKQAALKKGTSFDFIAENRLFSGSDSYSLTITFPLKGCQANIDIFGFIFREDVDAEKVIFDCEIRDGAFFRSGSITITEINEVEVKVQFLEGRSEQNFDKTFDKVYINELDLGAPTIYNPASIEPWEAWHPVRNGIMESVALPWWNSTQELPHNFAEYADGKYTWSADTHSLTWMPYLLFITHKICDAVGYEADFSTWEAKEEYKYLLICNVLPDAWDTSRYARALPHWTVDEYFEKLELFLSGEFNIDHRGKRISFQFTQDVLLATPMVELTSVIDEHTTEVTVENEKCDYLEAKNLVYKDPGYEKWKYYSCDWYINFCNRLSQGVVRYNTLNELLSANKWLSTWENGNIRGSNLHNLLYAADVDTYFIIRTASRTDLGKNLLGHPTYSYHCVCQPVNIFGGRIVDNREDADEIELEFIPVCVDDTEEKYGLCAFLDMSDYSESSGSGGGYRDSFDYEAFAQTGSQSTILAGAKDSKAEYYNCIYIGFWDGTPQTQGKLPYPYVEDIAVADDWSGYTQNRFSLRLNDPQVNAHRIVHRIDPKQKTTFKFLADSIPNVRAVFIIRNKRYICAKLTATFSEYGMSQLIKGEFYKLLD